MKIFFIYVPLPDIDQAKKISRQLLQENLIACANLSAGGLSIYRWEGKIEESAEVYACFKSSEEKLPALRKRIRELHPYTTPCIADFAVENLNEDYAAWLKKELSP